MSSGENMAVIGSTKLGVVGTGAMGRGIAQVAARAGITAWVYDSAPGRAREAVDAIREELARRCTEGKISKDAVDQACKRLHVVDTLESLADSTVVIEAVVEDLDVKRRLFAQLEQIVSDDCLLATNTSSLLVTSIASGCRRPERVGGAHFFNPVPAMKIVEVIAGVRTAPTTVEKLCALVLAFGHTPVVVVDSPGFLINHAGRAFYFPIGDDATTTALSSGLDPERVMALDALLADARHLTLMPTVVTREDFRDALFGMITKGGGAATLIHDSPGFVAQRVLAMIVNVSADIAQQRIAAPKDIDVAVRVGLGYPAGPLSLGDAIGAKTVLAILDRMHAFYGDPRYRPSPWLKRRALVGRSLLQEDA
jgi:3-hydroxyacyl-CoA dehydrogenase